MSLRNWHFFLHNLVTVIVAVYVIIVYNKIQIWFIVNNRFNIISFTHAVPYVEVNGKCTNNHENWFDISFLFRQFTRKNTVGRILLFEALFKLVKAVVIYKMYYKILIEFLHWKKIPISKIGNWDISWV